MKKIIQPILALLSLSVALSCNDRPQLTVYVLKPLKGSKTIECIKDESIKKEPKSGDTVNVNLDDSVIEPDGKEKYIVLSSYLSYKD